MVITQKISPNLWFNTQAEDAVNFYIDIFRNSRIIRTAYYGREGFETHGMPAGTVLTIEFELEGQNFLAMNGGSAFTFCEAISFVVHCDSQDEIDYYWGRLTRDGDEKAQQCGWLKDKFGVSWQIIPNALDDMMVSDDKEKRGRAMTAMLQMKKLNIAALREAYEGK